MEYIFTRQEREVYELLAKSSGLSVVELSEKTKIHRPSLYKLLEKMQSENLITTKKKETSGKKVGVKELGKRLVYVITKKENLEKKIEKSKLEFEKEKELFDLESKRLLSTLFSGNPVTFISSKAEAVLFYETLATRLGEQECYYSFGSGSDLETIRSVLSNKFRKLREGKNLWSYVVAAGSSLGHSRFSLAIKYGDFPSMPDGQTIVSYLDTTAYLDIKKGTGYVITDQNMASVMQGIIKKVYDMI